MTSGMIILPHMSYKKFNPLGIFNYGWKRMMKDDIIIRKQHGRDQSEI